MKLHRSLLSLGRWRRVGLPALRAAWQTFAMAMMGWRVSGYDFHVWEDRNRHTGSVTMRRPCYPGDPDDPRGTGWGLSSHGETWPAVWPSPIDAVTQSRDLIIVVARADAARAGAT